MAKIVVHLGRTMEDGEKITFKAPCDSSAADGLKVYAKATTGAATETGYLFSFRDANGESLNGTPGLFVTGAYVTVALDTTNNRAYIHNAANITAPDGKKWTEITMPAPPSPQSPSTNSVTWGNGKFVVVGGLCQSAYSADGINWTRTTLPGNDDTYTSVTWGNGKFVAIGGSALGAICAYSADGINWTQATIPAADWTGVTWGNGKFVAVGASGAAAYSTDGINWTQSTIPAADWYGVTWGNGKFVAVGASGAAAYSTDGVNWTQATIPAEDWYGVTWGNGKFVVAGIDIDDIRHIAYSTDGINWTSVELYEVNGNNTASVAWGNGNFVVFSGAAEVAYSRTTNDY